MTNGMTMTNAVIECILSRSAAKYCNPAGTLSDDQIRELVGIGTTAPDQNCIAKAGTGAGRFEADSRYVHQDHRVHSKYDGDLRAEPDRVQRMGHPARLFEESFATT